MTLMAPTTITGRSPSRYWNQGRWCPVIACLLALGWFKPVPAQCTREIYAIDSGWYDATGRHDPNNQYYLVGDSSVPNQHPPYRNWFVFDIPPLHGPVGSASLEVYTHALGSVDGTEFYQLRQVTTPIAVLQAGGTGLTNIYQDLGDGVIFGGGPVATNQRGATLSIPLNADFIDALTAAQGGKLAMGGAITTLDATPGNDEYIFGALQQTSASPGIYVHLHLNYALGPVPFFLYEPVSTERVLGSSALLSSEACAQAPPHYQWTLNETNLPAGTSAVLLLTNLSPAQAGDYRVIATAGTASITSAVARVTVSPIVIQTQLVSQVVLLSNAFQLALTARGAPPLIYRWVKDGALLVEGTNNSFTVPAARLADAGDYFVIVTNSSAVRTSAVAHVSVEARAPVFLVQPADASFFLEPPTEVILHSLAQGGPPPTYRWYFNGTLLSGAAQSNLVIQPASAANAGDYQVVAANSLGKATSVVARLSVQPLPPQIYQQPLSMTAEAGNGVQLSVGASGDALTYQWYFNEDLLPGETGSLLWLGAVTPEQAGSYYVMVLSPWGSVKSAVVTVTVIVRGPQFLIQPASVSVLAGADVFLSGYANGSSPIFYQWRFNGGDIADVVSPNLYLPSITTNQAGRYSIVARNDWGETESTQAVVAVRVQAPRLIIEPVGREAHAGDFFNLYAAAEAGPPAAYQWRFNGAGLPGETNNGLTFSFILPEQAGRYDVIAHNELGAVTSAVAVVTVRLAAPEFINQPQSQTVRAGDFFSLYASAYGAPPPLLQWRFNGGDIPGAHGSFLGYPAATASQAGAYTVVASNSAGLATSDVALVTVKFEAPQFHLQPQGGTYLAGSYIQLEAGASGAPPPAYQWLRDGQPLRNQLSPSLVLVNAQTNEAGRYRVMASNQVGVATSDVAVVTIQLSAPEFIEEPLSQDVLAGGFAQFSGSAVGGPRPAYQWLFNGSKLHGATNETLGINGVAPAQAGNYALVAFNTIGSVTSVVAVLTVEVQPPQFVRQPVSRSVFLGTALELDGEAIGAPPPGYRWFKEGLPIPQPGGSVFSILEAQFKDSGSYTLVATNIGGRATSMVAVVTVTTSVPRFIDQPKAQTARAGDSVYFVSAAEGGPPPDYQWQFLGEDLPGETSSALSLPEVATNQAGAYRVLAHNSYGAATSSVAVLSVTVQAPRFQWQPQNLSLLLGQTDQLYASASGAPPPAYQWRRDGVPLPGATRNTLAFAPATDRDQGQYSVLASNVAGIATSRVAVVTIKSQAPVFIQEPADTTLPAGAQLLLGALAMGGPPPAYQWRHDGHAIPGGTDANYVIASVSTADQGGYSVLASNELGAVTSRVAQVTVQSYPPRFEIQPRNQSLPVGQWINLFASADGAPGPEYQWLHDGSPIVQARSQYLQLMAGDSSFAGNYYAMASNALGTATSEVAVVTIELFAPEFVLEPADATALQGDTVAFIAQAAASPPSYYQWQFNGVDLAGQRENVLHFYEVSSTNEGLYTLVASNALGMVTSRVATLTVLLQAPEFILDPRDTSIAAGGYLQLRGQARAGPPPQYQWYFEDHLIAGATDPVLTLASVSTHHAGAYVLVAQNPLGRATSAVAVVTVTVQAPLFVQQPSSQMALAGESVTFSAWADGSPPPWYQWYFNGTPIPGARGTQLLLPSTATNQAGRYSLVAGNSFGVITSRVATLTVQLAAPAFVDEPEDRSSWIGNFVRFSARATGGPSPTYQWHFQGMAISNAQLPDLDFAVATTNQAGSYSVVAQNSLGSITSRVATLTVELHPPEFRFQPGDIDALAGDSVAFSADAQGSPPPSYRWLFQGAPLPGQSNSYLTIRTTFSDAGEYAVVAGNFLGAVTSRVARLTVRAQAPHLYYRPSDTQAPVGSRASLCAYADGGPPPTYQWRFNAEDLPGATDSCLELYHVSPNQGGAYTVVVRNAFGAITSAVATLTVLTAPPRISSVSAAPSLIEGMTYDVLVTADGAPPPHLLLLREGQVLPLQRRDYSGFHLPEISTNDAGLYSVVATNGYGAVTSITARLEVTRAGPLDRWTRRNPEPTGHSLLSLAYGNGLFVAVGDQCTLLTSSNGIDWLSRSLRASSALTGIAFGGGQFVATGAGGLLLTSSNGVDWIPQGNENSDWPKITYGGGRFVAVGNFEAASLSSTDGVVWTQQMPTLPTPLHAVAWGAGKFVAITPLGETFTSPDGANWAPTPNDRFNAPIYQGVAFLQDQFVVVGSSGWVATSPDGADWQVAHTEFAASFNAIAYGNGYYVAVGDTGIRVSQDLTHWIAPGSDPSFGLNDVLFADGRFVVSGGNGIILVSTDARTWRNVTGVTHEMLWATAGSRDRLVAVGEGGTILTSTNGAEFARAESGVRSRLQDVAFANGLFVVVGSGGTVLTSADARLWQAQQLNPLYDLQRAVYGQSGWVVVGRGGVALHSPDGTTWTEGYPITSGDGFIDAAYGQGVFVAIGSSDGSAFVSPDGTSWATAPIYTDSSLRSVGFAGGRFLAIDDEGHGFSSTNGYAWDAEASIGLYPWTGKLAHARGIWLVPSRDGMIFTTGLPVNFVRRVSRSTDFLTGSAFFQGRFVAVGLYGTILQSDRLGAELSAARTATGLQLTAVGEPGEQYRLQASDDLIHWVTLQPLSLPEGVGTYLAPSPVSGAQRFYRLVAP